MPGAIEACLPERRRDGRVAHPGAAPRQLKLRRVHAPERYPPVDIGHAVGVVAVDAIGVREADTRLPADVPLRAQQVVDRMVGAGRRRGGIVDRRQERDGGARHLAGEFHRRHRLHDPASVDELVRDVEQLDAVEEEWPLLREEQRQARIERNLSGIRFHLGEVGVGGAVEREIVGDSPANVAADLGVLHVVAPPARLRAADHLRRELGVDVDHHAAAQIGQPGQRPRLRQK